MIARGILILISITLIGIGFYQFFNRPPFIDDPESPTVQSADCQVSPDILNPVIDINSPEVAKVIENGYSQELKMFVQHVELKDQKRFEYTEGGCVHFSYEITFSPYKPSSRSSHQIAQDALEQLKRPLFHSQEKISIFNRALANVLIQPDMQIDSELILECGDASCSLSVIENKLILSYDMPL